MSETLQQDPPVRRTSTSSTGRPRMRPRITVGIVAWLILGPTTGFDKIPCSAPAPSSAS